MGFLDGGVCKRRYHECPTRRQAEKATKCICLLYFAKGQGQGYSPRNSTHLIGKGCVLISTAYAQAGGGGGGQILFDFFPIIIIIAIVYFLIFRPQQQRVKEHRAMVAAVRRGDTVVTSGGILGKVTRVMDDSDEIQVEIADGVRVKIIRSTLSDVRSKSDPVPANDTEKKGN